VDGQLAARSDRIVQTGRTFAYTMYRAAVPLQITQNDVRAIQLAKPALHAGGRLLMDHMAWITSTDPPRRCVRNHIDVKYATILGMIPDCELSQVSSAGNAAAPAHASRCSIRPRADRRGVGAARGKDRDRNRAEIPAHFVAAMAFRTRANRICICGGWCSCRPGSRFAT